MTEKITIKKIQDMIYQLGVLITDENHGLITTTMKRNHYEEYKQFDTITAWECYTDEINRIQSIIELHDLLTDCTEKQLKTLLPKKEKEKE